VIHHETLIWFSLDGVVWAHRTARLQGLPYLQFSPCSRSPPEKSLKKKSGTLGNMFARNKHDE
jgi:hypothetical protein